ncbi:MAG: hypothetical protein R3Y24_04145 [Eubacteriales bacterium]
MLFNSYIFVFIFLPLVLMGWYVLNHYKKEVLAEYILILMSLWFYAYFNLSYLPIILISIICNYTIGKWLLKATNEKYRKYLLIIGIILNVGILFYYKYMGFFLQTVNMVFQTEFFIQNIILPLGISFFTFQQLSYIVDCYRKEVPKYLFRQYALFVTFFPQLIAGPIVLHSETVPQFSDKKKRLFRADNFSVGLMAFSTGMAKKIIIADSFGNIVNYGYANIESLGSLNALFVMILVLVGTLCCKNTNEKILAFQPTVRNALFCSLLLFYSIISFSGISTFLYFNF